MTIRTPQQVMSIIYGNGGDKPATIRFWEDGGHGWLQVPKHLLKELNIVTEVSGCSYMTIKDAYLEEDCDLSLFMQAIGMGYTDDANALPNQLRTFFWQNCPKEYHEDSPIRNMEPYNHPLGNRVTVMRTSIG